MSLRKVKFFPYDVPFSQGRSPTSVTDDDDRTTDRQTTTVPYKLDRYLRTVS